MRILLLGKYGQLGWELNRTLGPLGEIYALDFPEIDLSRPDSIHSVIREAHPHIVVNATAYTDVDRAEDESEKTMAINGHAPGLMAEITSSIGAALIHYSTDYVFDGTKGAPYSEKDPPNPLNEYGKSKLAGEQAISQVDGAHLIFRTSWVYSLRRENFVTKVLSWSRKQETLRIVSDQISNPTWARMLAEISSHLIALGERDISRWVNERKGIYHLAGTGFASRLEWAEAILRFDPRRDQQIAEKILPARSFDFPTPARRPLFSGLNCDHFSNTFGLRLPPWETSLQLAMQDG
jgi:dTDP-4-dehydrorhamnose reductase